MRPKVTPAKNNTGQTKPVYSSHHYCVFWWYSMLCILMVFNAVFSDGIHSVISDGVQCCVFWWYSMLCILMVFNTVFSDGIQNCVLPLYSNHPYCVFWWYSMLCFLMVFNAVFSDGIQYCIFWWYSMLSMLCFLVVLSALFYPFLSNCWWPTFLITTVYSDGTQCFVLPLPL